MKYFVAVGIIFFIAGQAYAQQKTSRELDGLVGPVRTVTTTSFRFTRSNEQWMENGEPHLTTISYDENGNDPNRSRLQSPQYGAHCVSKTNDAGQIIERDCLTQGRGMKFFFAYDAAGRVIDEAQQDETGKLIRRLTFGFDDKGRRVSLGEFDSDNHLQRGLTWSFDDKGNQTEWTESRKTGDQMVLFQKNVWTYDDRGNALTETQYGNPEGSVLEQFFAYEFDERGNWIKKEGASMPLDSPDLQSKFVEIRSIVYYQ